MSERTVDARQIVGVLAAESRTQLWAEVVVSGAPGREAVSVDDLSAGQKRHLRALERAGLVTVSDGRVRHSQRALQDAVKSLPQTNASAGGPERFLVDGLLGAIPRRAKDRIEVLEYVSRQVFPDEDATLTEREVMQRLSSLARDPVGVRRALVDCGLVARERDGSRYWRAHRP